MAEMFVICVAFTLRQEGGYVDDPADPGGATNMGITLATYREWSDDPDLGAFQVKDLTLKTARAIYRALYWNPLRAEALPPGVDLSVFDMGVNAGIWRSARLLQRALGFTGEEVDGAIGPGTLAAADRFDPRILVRNQRFAETITRGRRYTGDGDASRRDRCRSRRRTGRRP
jgi:lysozyme family protein